jgi:hypothetical protein
VRPIGAAILIVLAAIAVGCTSHLYVDADAPAGGDGSKAKPFKTIREGVDAARARTTVHVAEGTYTEKPEMIVAHGRVRLKGSTVLTLDPRGLPAGDEQKREHSAIVKAETAIPKDVALFRIHAADVAITGLVIDGKTDTATSQGILMFFDGAQGGVDGFQVKGNVLVNAGTAVVARLAAGTIQGNYIGGQSSGVHIYGWRPEPSPPRKRILFERNRVAENGTIGALLYGSLGSQRVPKFESPSVSDGPGALRITVSRNDFLQNGGPLCDFPTRNPSTALHFLLNDNSQSDPLLGAQDRRGHPREHLHQE